MSNLIALKNDDTLLIDYVRYVLSLDTIDQDTTVLLHTSKTYGIVTPSMVMAWIAKGSIVIVYNENVAA